MNSPFNFKVVGKGKKKEKNKLQQEINTLQNRITGITPELEN